MTYLPNSCLIIETSIRFADQSASCWAGHLSSFTVIRVVEGVSADYVLGVLVAVLMGVLVFAVMLVFFVQQKREDSAIKNTSKVAPAPPPVQPIIQGSSQSFQHANNGMKLS